MMINEEKLLKLLEVAVNNNWKPNHIYLQFILDRDEFNIKPNLDIRPVNTGGLNTSISVNDLVTNWEEGEVSFIEALCKTIQHCPAYDIIGNDEFEPRNIRNLKETDSYTIQWILLPTSKRLDFLFTTFNHLL